MKFAMHFGNNTFSDSEGAHRSFRFSNPGLTVPAPERPGSCQQNLNVIPPKLPSARDQTVLPSLAFEIVDDLAPIVVDELLEGLRQVIHDEGYAGPWSSRTSARSLPLRTEWP